MIVDTLTQDSKRVFLTSTTLFIYFFRLRFVADGLSRFAAGIVTKNAVKNIFYFGACLLQCFVQSLQEVVLRATSTFTFSHLSITADKKPVKEAEGNIRGTTLLR